MNSDPTIIPQANGAFELTDTIDLTYPLEEVFDFFSRPENLAKLTPTSMGFKLLTPGPVDMRAGLILEYRIRPLKFPMRWRSKIETWNPPHEFSDSQAKGPFKSWQHSHRFQATDTGTRIEDRVVYRVPGGPLAEKLFVRNQLLDQFRYRAQRMKELFPAD